MEFRRVLFRSAVPLIQEQEIPVRIIGHEKIDLPVLIEIVEHGSESVRRLHVTESSALGDIGESAIAIVVIKRAAASFETDGTAKPRDVQVGTNRRRLFERERVNVNIAGYVQIQIAVAVKIAKRATRVR